METETEIRGRTNCTCPTPTKVLSREDKMLTLKFIGRDSVGRYVFRNPADPLKLVVTDYQGFWEIRMLRAQMRPIIDAEMANDILALQQKIEAIEPGFNAEKWLSERDLI